MRRLDGRIAIVTGGSSGFGRATAVRLASEGAKILVADLDEPNGQETLGLVGQVGGESDLFVGDIATPEGAAAMYDRTLERFGTVDILVNNAGIEPQGEAACRAATAHESMQRSFHDRVAAFSQPRAQRSTAA